MNPESERLINPSVPYVMHIDLNSCFAIIEQQANRLLRGKPVGIAAYDTPRGFVLAASYEAKAKGIKLGVTVEQSRSMCPGICIMTPDPAKYREAHRRFREALLCFTPDVHPKSIDEFVLNMKGSPVLREKLQAGMEHNAAMLEIGREMKLAIARSLGEWVTVNVGISTNRFLAKYAAGFGKPDGMMLIDHHNLTESYEGMHLVDLPGINLRYRARLRAAGIYTPLDFLHAELSTLKKRVFKSIVGYYWYLRLRGHEIDEVESITKTIGHQYALSQQTTDMEKLERLLMKLCEKTGRRLRRNNYYAQGIHLYMGFASEYPMYDGPASFENMQTITSWSHGEKVWHRLHATHDIFQAAKRLLHQAEIPRKVKIMSVHVFNLAPWDPEQLSLFGGNDFQEKQYATHGVHATASVPIRQLGSNKRLSEAVDMLNDRYGEFIVTSALMMDMQGTILDRIAFGQVRDL